ncbi:MAG: sulfite exporter TauE/SafE family protein [Bacteroidetes bacterium]|nr:sulfite exporter TauE/SafE family protein [Bacteroidota bacterium]
MTSIIIILAVGIMAGMFSGFIGIGGGLIIVPCLVYFFGMSQHEAQGTSLAMMLPPIGILAVLNYHRQGMVDWKVAAILCITFIAGSFFGSKIAISLDASMVKKVFAVFMLLVALKMFFGK